MRIVVFNVCLRLVFFTEIGLWFIAELLIIFNVSRLVLLDFKMQDSHCLA